MRVALLKGACYIVRSHGVYLPQATHLSHTAPTKRYAMKRSVAELYLEVGILEMLPDGHQSESPVPSLAPAEKRHCAATVLDSESEEKVPDSESNGESQASEAASDDLCRMWEKERVETPPASPSDSLDSQLSANEDPNCQQCSPKNENMDPCPPNSNEKHWTEDRLFWLGVEDVLAVCLPHKWFSNDFFYQAPIVFAQNLAASANFIRKLLSEGSVTKFKIGITENPWQRWELYKADRRFELYRTMYILYAATTSKWKITRYDSDRRKDLKRTSTGAMEIALVEGFEGCLQCVNRARSGGDVTSGGSPHFVYVVIV